MLRKLVFMLEIVVVFTCIYSDVMEIARPSTTPSEEESMSSSKTVMWTLPTYVDFDFCE